MKTETVPGQGTILAAFAAIYLIWGSTYIAILAGLHTIPPFLLSGIRFSTAGAILLAWRLAQGERPAIQPTLQHAFAGILMLFGGTGAVVWSEQYISSGMAATIVASMPFWFVLLDYKQWSFNFSNGLILTGVTIGFAGILTLFGWGSFTTGHSLDAQSFAMLALLGGCLAWASGSLYLKYRPVTMSTTLGAGIQMLAAGLFSLAVSWQQGETSGFALVEVSAQSWLGLAYLISFGSLIGYLSYVWLLKIRPTVQVGTYAYVNPVVAMLLGWLIASEPLDWQQAAALGVILSGVLLINLPKYRSLGLTALKGR